ncbi:hypothetical protein ACHAXR_010095 [Thalassiosira sp. AJA248-18]
MANDNGDLFGDSSSSDADTDDLIAAAKSQPIATKKAGAAPKTKAASSKKTPDADNDDDDDDDNDSDFEGGKEETAGLFDSSSEDESGPKKKKLGKKRKAAGGGKKKSASATSGGGKKKPAKKDTRSKKERMEALAKRRAGGDASPEKSKEPRKKRSKSNNKEGGGEAGGGGDGKEGGEGGYQSGDSYGSENFQRTKEDDDFIDADDEDPDALKELYSEQHFEDERPDGYDSEEEEKAQKKKAASGRKSSAGGGLDKISLSDDEGGAPSATSALKEAVKRMRKTKKEAKKLPELEEEGVAFLKRMDAAADADDESIAARRPAMKKLAMLQDVMDMLARKDMVRVLLDLELLSVCKRWVQPLPNGSLGNVTLRRRIMESISTMTGENGVHASDLKQSGFGKVVMTLYMHKSETPEMKKMLKGIIEQWSRPIFQKSGNMRDLERAQAARGMSETGSLVGIARARAAETKMEERRKMGGDMKHGRNVGEVADIISGGPKSAGEIGSSRVRVPFSKGFQYSIRPESRRGDVSDKRNLVSAKGAAGPRDGDKRDALGKRMIEKSRKTNKQNSRSANISIEGRVTK